MLAKNELEMIFFESSYSLFKTKPRDSTSSDIAVASAISTVYPKVLAFPNIANSLGVRLPFLAYLSSTAVEKNNSPTNNPISRSGTNFLILKPIPDKKLFFSNFLIYKKTGVRKINGLIMNSSIFSGREKLIL